MNDIDGGVGMLAIQFLIFLGAVEGHLEFCIAIVAGEIILMFLGIPVFILWIIKNIFGTAAAVGVGVLAVALYLWMRYEDKRVEEKFKKMRH